MRFMVLLYGASAPHAGPTSPDLELALQRYREELVRAGVLLASEVLLPGTTGVRLRVDRSGRRRMDGRSPAEADLKGFLLLQVSSREEAVEWASRYPLEATLRQGEEADVEIRQVVEPATVA